MKHAVGENLGANILDRLTAYETEQMMPLQHLMEQYSVERVRRKKLR
jgi:hypothetical protein